MLQCFACGDRDAVLLIYRRKCQHLPTVFFFSKGNGCFTQYSFEIQARDFMVMSLSMLKWVVFIT